MAQAKTLTPAEIKQVLGTLALRKHSVRNRTMFLLTIWAGLRVSEVAALRYCDVVGPNGKVLGEIRLLPEMTKGQFPRTVFVSDKLQKELARYVSAHPARNPDDPLFYTQKRAGFNRNTLAQHFYAMYRWAGIPGASSHSGRRSFITTLSAAGISIKVLASLAGHRSIQTTAGYISVNDDMKRRAVELA
jgi:integrase/recombinase XerD